MARKGDGVCQTADSRWIATVEGERGVDGRRCQIRKRFDTEREARAWKHQQETAKLQGKLPKRQRVTLAAFVEDWLTTVAPARGIKDRSLLDYRQYLERYVVPSLGTVRLSDLAPLDFDRLYLTLLKTGRTTPAKSNKAGPKKARPLSARTVRHLHTIVRDMLESARKKRLILSNPAADAEVPRVEGASRTKMSVWTADECRRFLDRADIDGLQALWHLLLTTGMRLGEARGLTWPDIDLKACRIHVAATESLDLEGETKRTTPKTQSGDRTIPMPAQLVPLLKEHRRCYSEARMKLQQRPTVEYVFSFDLGKPADESAVRRRFLKLASEAKVRRIRVHDMRHTFASMALGAGIPVTDVSAILGHANPAITMALYAHFIPGNEHRPSDAVVAAIYGPR